MRVSTPRSAARRLKSRQQGRPRDLRTSDNESALTGETLEAGEYSLRRQPASPLLPVRSIACYDAATLRRTAAPMHKLLFVTKYIDHILYFFLDQLSRKTELTIFPKVCPVDVEAEDA